MDIEGTIEYYKAKIPSIRVTGQINQDRRGQKIQLEYERKQEAIRLAEKAEKEKKEKKDDKNHALNYEQRVTEDHDHFIRMLKMLNEYKQNVCFD